MIHLFTTIPYLDYPGHRGFGRDGLAVGHGHVPANLLRDLDTLRHLLVLTLVLRHLLANLLSLVFANLLGNFMTIVGRSPIAGLV